MVMIESIEFKNFKALRDTTLPLGPCTIIVGPNGSGKSTVLQALEYVRQPNVTHFSRIKSFGVDDSEQTFSVEVKLNWGDPFHDAKYVASWSPRWHGRTSCNSERHQQTLTEAVNGIRTFSLDAAKIAAPAPVRGSIELASDGGGLAGILDGFRDEAPESFKSIESQIGEWLPEFDGILFDRPQEGFKSVALRTREGHFKVPASDLSQGTLIALALLTLAYHPTPPSLIALEEPDRGVHPYLLRHVQDTLYRLSHPESCGEQREPVQVIATTHSPYFLDLFKDNPEEIVIANKVGADVQFQKLSDQPHVKEYLEDAHLGDIWYTGILGGVPCRP
jgi:predicted ATPase